MERAGAASAISETTQELGLALGIAILGSIATAVYRAQLIAAIPAGVPTEAAEAVRDTLGGATGVADQLSAGLLTTAGQAFTNGVPGNRRSERGGVAGTAFRGRDRVATGAGRLRLRPRYSARIQNMRCQDASLPGGTIDPEGLHLGVDTFHDEREPVSEFGRVRGPECGGQLVQPIADPGLYGDGRHVSRVRGVGELGQVSAAVRLVRPKSSMPASSAWRFWTRAMIRSPTDAAGTASWW